jgi:undecaprenyl-diphosphatase
MLLPNNPPLWTALSAIGAPRVMTVLCLLVALGLAAQRRPRAAIAVLLIDGLGGLLNVGLKNIVQRPRPPGAELIMHGHSWSFPSGHAMGAMIGYGMLCYWTIRYGNLDRSARQLTIALAALIVALVGISRVGLGVHYPTDVLGGWAIGGGWLWLGIRLFQRSESSAALRSAPER